MDKNLPPKGRGAPVPTAHVAGLPRPLGHVGRGCERYSASQALATEPAPLLGASGGAPVRPGFAPCGPPWASARPLAGDRDRGRTSGPLTACRPPAALWGMPPGPSRASPRPLAHGIVPSPIPSVTGRPAVRGLVENGPCPRRSARSWSASPTTGPGAPAVWPVQKGRGTRMPPHGRCAILAWAASTSMAQAASGGPVGRRGCAVGCTRPGSGTAIPGTGCAPASRPVWTRGARRRGTAARAGPGRGRQRGNPRGHSRGRCHGGPAGVSPKS
jgi:hypothetical protein